MAAPELDFDIYTLDTGKVAISIVDENGTAFSLIGAQKIRWWVAKKVTTTPLIEKSANPGGGITVVSAPGGLIEINIASSDTANLKGDYYHELEVVDSAGNIQTVLVGTMTVLRALITDP
jgi:hypothetical protein